MAMVGAKWKGGIRGVSESLGNGGDTRNTGSRGELRETSEREELELCGPSGASNPQPRHHFPLHLPPSELQLPACLGAGGALRVRPMGAPRGGDVTAGDVRGPERGWGRGGRSG